jgi:benzoyl-CoA reductase subunit C
MTASSFYGTCPGIPLHFCTDTRSTAIVTEKGASMNELDHFLEAADQPERYGAGIKAGGTPVLGYLCSYAPEEIIHAAGVHPLRLFGTLESTIQADSHLQAYCCSLARGVLESALDGTLAFLDGAVFPHTCDTIQRLSDIWRLNTHFDFFADVVHPVRLDSGFAREYLEDILQRFKCELEAWSGSKIDDAALARSIETFNAARKRLDDLYLMRSRDPDCISGSRVSSIVKASMILNRDELPGRLSRLLEEIKAGSYRTGGTDDKKRLLVAGSLCDHPDFYSMVENSGGVVVWDDLCTGSRAFDGFIDPTGDHLKAIARRYFERRPCPSKHLSNTARGEALAAMAEKHKVQGILFFLLKFCDPHAFDYPYLKEYLEAKNIPVTLIEVEDSLPPEGQLATRLETFIYTL